MSGFSILPEKGKGSPIDRLVLFCTIIAISCVLGAHILDLMGKSGGLPTVSFVAPDKHPGVDYSATATIPRRANATNLNPCGQY
jgi:hypothetical protein